MSFHLVAGNISDLEVCLGYLRISKSILDMSEIRKARGVYVSTIKLAKPYNKVSADIKSRFGRFLQLRKI